MCCFMASCSFPFSKVEREGGRRPRSQCRALISSLMDFVSGMSVSNHAFIMGSLIGGGIDSKTPQHVKQIAFIFNSDVMGSHLH